MKRLFNALVTFLVAFLESFSMAPMVGDVSLTGHFAKVKYGEMIADLRGKINGTVHSRNKGGAYMRNLSIPSNPQTSAQSAVRSRLASLSAAFRSLTQSQIAAWNAASSDFPSVNVFGDSRELSGAQLYVGLNSNIQNAGGSTISDPPAPQGAAGLDSVTLAADINGDVMTAAFAPSPVPADTALIIEATRQLSPGITNANNQFRQIAVEAAAETSPADIFAAYTARFGALVEGRKVFVRVKQINLLTGERSQTLVGSTIVVDTTV